MALVTVLAYRRIAVAGRLMVVLWVGMLLTVAWVIVTGLDPFRRRPGVRLPRRGLAVSMAASAIGLGMALAIAMYDFLGYYQVCYLGDEVADPSRTIPRSILISVVVVGLIYLVMNVGILGVLPWREVVESKHVASDLMLRVHGPWAAGLVDDHDHLDGAGLGVRRPAGLQPDSLCVGAGRPFLQGASPRPTRRGHFPHRSLLLIGGLATLACLADLETVIAALLTSRILIQFVGQIATVFYLRSATGAAGRSRSMPLFPLPALFALAGWLFVFVDVGTARPDLWRRLAGRWESSLSSDLGLRRRAAGDCARRAGRCDRLRRNRL